jgi:hypothetical protein
VHLAREGREVLLDESQLFLIPRRKVKSASSKSHSFTGISQIVVTSTRTITAQPRFELTGPLVAPLDVQLNLNGVNNLVTEQVGNNGVVPSGLTFDIVSLRHESTTEVTVTP